MSQRPEAIAIDLLRAHGAGVRSQTLVSHGVAMPIPAINELRRLGHGIDSRYCDTGSYYVLTHDAGEGRLFDGEAVA